MSAPLLEIDDLSVGYGTQAVLDRVSLTVSAGEIVGIVGESGSGKSTLAHAIPNLLPPSARIEARRFVLNGHDLLNTGDRQRGSDMAMIFQDPSTSLSPLFPIGRQLTAFLEQQSGDRASRRRDIVAMLARVGIADPARRFHAYPHELSGGMLQRVMIAAALLAKPRLIVADEPTTALDVTIAAQILHLLRRIRDEDGTAILLISHQLGIVAELCDRVAVIERGRIVENGPAAHVLGTPGTDYARWLVACEHALHDPARPRLPTRELAS